MRWSAAPERLAARLGLHYGWVIVGVTLLLLVASAGTRTAPGILIDPLEEDLGWSRGEISWALALSLVTLGFAGPASGWAVNRFGAYRMVLVFLALGTIGTAFTAAMHSLIEMYVAWGVLVGFGTGGVAMVLAATVSSTWFESKRGLVMGVLSGASSAGQFVFLFPLIGMEDAFGWRAAVAALALLLGAVVLPLVVVFFRSSPASVGLRRVGQSRAAAALADDAPIVGLREALRTHEFWLLCGSYAICGFTTSGLVGFHFIPHASEHGFSRTEASGIVTLMGVMNIAGTLGAGWLSDRYPPRKLLTVYYLLRAGTLLVLPFITTVPLMSLFAVAYGLDFVATVPPTVMLTAERYGRRSVPVLFGWITCVHMVGGAFAAAFAGQIHDIAGDYSIPIYTGGLLALMAAAMAFNIEPRKASTAAGAAAA